MSRVVIVGGGVVGASCAYYLARAGHRVAVVDRGDFGAGCSHANCGYVCPSHVLPLAVPGAVRSALAALLARNSPLKVRPGVVLRDPRWFAGFARRCNRRDMLAAGAAIRPLLDSSRKLFDELIAAEALDCEWETRGLLFVYRTRAAFEHYADTDRVLRTEFGTAAERWDADELLAREPALKPGPAGGWFYPGDAHLRPDRLMAELRRVLEARGVEIHTRTPALGLATGGGVRTPTGVLPADHTVLATGAWSREFAAALGCRVPVQPGKGYSITYPLTPDSSMHPMIFEEDRVAVTPFRSGLRIGSTMEFSGLDDTLDRGRLRLLTAAAAAYLRHPPTGTPTEEWWGWRPMTPDGLPLIGRVPNADNVWLAAGHNMLGLSMATATGKLVAELVTGTAPHLDPAPYSPARF